MKNLNLLNWFVFLLFIGALGSSCQKDPIENCEGKMGVFMQKDGCGIILELDDGRQFQDTSFRLWDVKTNGKTRYCVEHAAETSPSSSCEDLVAVEFLTVVRL